MNGDGDSSLDELERHFMASGHVLTSQQHEIGGLQKMCRNLQKDLDKSLGTQKMLKRQLHEMEAESAEMQEFLQAEKSTLADSLRDSEAELRNLRDRLSRQEEECKHLVRISEQRRQENLGLQARLTGVERRGRELLLQQGAAVSGASVALSGLSSRLDGLVEQLVAGYGISEQELEDVIFHNEAYTQSSSVEASPEKKRTNLPAGESCEEGSYQTVSTQVPTHPPRPSRAPHRRSPASPAAGASFVSAVISAIKSAAAPFSYRSTTTTVPQDVSSSSEPSLTPAHEADNSEAGTDLPEDLPEMPPTRLAGSESLQNLSRAIMQRQVTENEEEEDSLPLSPPHTSPLSSSSSPSDATAEDGERRRDKEKDRSKGEGRSTLTPPPTSGADSLVDQVIEVDNLLTKLLKVLRIIQLENDACIEEMQEERSQLSEKARTAEEKKNKTQEQLQGWEQMGTRLRSELSEALLLLRSRTKELEEARLMLTKLQEEVSLPDSRDHLNERDHINELNKKYAVSNKLLTDNWRQALSEVRRQYDAIDNALETLHSVQGVVLQCPPLAKLQQDLEEANFLSATLPVIGLDTDPNANAAVPSGMVSPDRSDPKENGMKEEGLNGRA
ncbi:hypothetical protein J437_LFUL009481 [Ladona fulva]|uniref:Uncharacterized protein n=1 Tax=Ladona fulva TaxID=123851 RepID=A0A8K0JZZ8_LADFU|nr:hypothetical protein J437_LFUL009481 [Ladona fulva]